ncbi:MAG TPA: hypothetical protein VFW71_17000, partial [Actinomycetota bacterium]|nr:hypothetical protein [Actinomycetota bacterium]
AEDVSCVLNKAEPDNGIDLDELLRVYPRGFAAVLPYSKEVSRSLNVGKPVLMVDPRAEISQKILEAGAKLVPGNEIRNPGWMARPTARPGWTSWRKDRHAPAAAVPVPVPQVPVVNGPAYPALLPRIPTPAAAPTQAPAAAARAAAGRPEPLGPASEPRLAPTSLEPLHTGGMTGYDLAELLASSPTAAPVAVPVTPARPVPSTPYPPSRTGVLMPPTGGPAVPVGAPPGYPAYNGSAYDKHPKWMDRLRGFFGHKAVAPPAPPQIPVSFAHPPAQEPAYTPAQRPLPPPPAQLGNYTGPGLSSPLGGQRPTPAAPADKAAAPQKIVFNANRGGGATSFGPPRTRPTDQRPTDLRSTSWKEPRR